MRFRASLNDQRQFEINQLPEILQKATRTKFVNFGSIVISFSPAQTSVASKDCTSLSLITGNFNLFYSTPEEKISLTHLDQNNFVTPSLKILGAK